MATRKSIPITFSPTKKDEVPAAIHRRPAVSWVFHRSVKPEAMLAVPSRISTPPKIMASDRCGLIDAPKANRNNAMPTAVQIDISALDFALRGVPRFMNRPPNAVIIEVTIMQTGHATEGLATLLQKIAM